MDKYLAYPFLYDDSADLKCDFEILSDEISSMIGLVRSLLDDKDKSAAPEMAEDLSKINELMYHINPSLRTRTMITVDELNWLYQKSQSLHMEVEEDLPKRKGPSFFLPQGCTQAALSHVIRNRCKTLVRLLSRYQQQGNHVNNILFDITNLFSGYFYFLALWFNKIHGVKEQPFFSRVY